MTGAISPAAAKSAAFLSPAASKSAAAARQFEAVFAGQMIAAAFATLDSTAAGEGGMGGGSAEAMWRGVLAEHIGAAMAARGVLGVAALVAAQAAAPSPEPAARP